MLVLDMLDLIEDQERERSASILVGLGEQGKYWTRGHLFFGLGGIGYGDTLALDKRMILFVLE